MLALDRFLGRGPSSRVAINIKTRSVSRVALLSGYIKTEDASDLAVAFPLPSNVHSTGGSGTIATGLPVTSLLSGLSCTYICIRQCQGRKCKNPSGSHGVRMDLVY